MKKFKLLFVAFVLFALTTQLAFAEITVQGEQMQKVEGAYPVTTFIDDVATGKILVIDVRTPSEFAAGHVPQAINIPLATDLEQALATLPTDKPIVFMCAAGKRASSAYNLVATKKPDLLSKVQFLNAGVQYKGEDIVIKPN